MQYQWINANNNNTNKSALIIYFAGWGTSPHWVTQWYLPSGCDLLVCWDYRDIGKQSINVDFSRYQQITLVAWSLGVWAAEQILPRLELNYTKTIAINGTPHPIDDRHGIPEAIFAGTLQGLTPKTRQKFERRMCGDTQLFEYYQQHTVPRSFDEVYAELEAIYQNYSADYQPSIVWDKAIIGDRDHIFPTINQQNYWLLQSTCQVISSPIPHFPFYYYQNWASLC